MIRKSVLCLAVLLLVLVVLATTVEGGRGGRKRRDTRVHDDHPDDRNEEDDDDKDDDDDDDDEDQPRGRRPKRKRGGSKNYDHESFLGRDEARKFDDMTPEESRRRLGEMFHKIDTNNDTKISEPEMEDWLREIARHDRIQHVESRFRSIKAAINDSNVNSSLTFDDWKKAMRHEIIGDEPADNETEASFVQQMDRDQFRWEKADANGDKKIDRPEFVDFLYSHQSPRMKEVVIVEALNISDLNRDGKIDLAEYMRDLYHEYEKEKRAGTALPKWVIKEEEHFKGNLDLNKDGILDADEIYKWTVPEDMDHAKKETKHLFEEADQNKDKLLTKDEVLRDWETFVGHQVTHFGEFKPQTHDEL